jgi:DNA-binding GntR family transcriptional regulator
LSLSDFEEIYLLRVANEPLLARLSVERLDDGNREVLEQLYTGMVQGVDDGALEWAEFLGLQREFHDLLYLAAGRPRMHRLTMQLRDASVRYLHVSATVADEPHQHLAGLRQLMDASRRNDGLRAENVMRRVLQRVRRRMRPVIERGGDVNTPKPAMISSDTKAPT